MNLFNQQPRDIIITIFLFLDSREKLIYRIVCRAWNTLLRLLPPVSRTITKAIINQDYHAFYELVIKGNLSGLPQGMSSRSFYSMTASYFNVPMHKYIQQHSQINYFPGDFAVPDDVTFADMLEIEKHEKQELRTFIPIYLIISSIKKDKTDVLRHYMKKIISFNKSKIIFEKMFKYMSFDNIKSLFDNGCLTGENIGKCHIISAIDCGRYDFALYCYNTLKIDISGAYHNTSPILGAIISRDLGKLKILIKCGFSPEVFNNLALRLAVFHDNWEAYDYLTSPEVGVYDMSDQKNILKRLVITDDIVSAFSVPIIRKFNPQALA